MIDKYSIVITTNNIKILILMRIHNLLINRINLFFKRYNIVIRYRHSVISMLRFCIEDGINKIVNAAYLKRKKNKKDNNFDIWARIYKKKWRELIHYVLFGFVRCEFKNMNLDLIDLSNHVLSNIGMGFSYQTNYPDVIMNFIDHANDYNYDYHKIIQNRPYGPLSLETTIFNNYCHRIYTLWILNQWYQKEYIIFDIYQFMKKYIILT